MGHDEAYGSRIRQGVIMICTPDLYYQEFKIQDAELKRWKHKWLARLDAYNDLQRDEKKGKTVSEELQSELEPIKDYDEHNRDTSKDPFKGTSIEGKD